MAIEISTVGATVWYQQEATAGTAPAMLDAFQTNSTWTHLANVNTAPSLGANPSTIDASNTKDGITRYIAGRIDPGGIQNLTFNMTSDGAVLTDWNGATSSTGVVGKWNTNKPKRIWLAYVFPDLKSGNHYIVFRFPIVPLAITGSQGITQNSLLTVEAPFIVDGMPEWYTTTAA